MLLHNGPVAPRAFVAGDPISGEILDIEHLEAAARELSRSHRLTRRGRSGREIMARVRANGRALLASYRSTARAIADQGSIVPAAEWLVDNFHVVDEQLREIRDDLSSGFYRGLPKLGNGHLAGYPRVLAIVWSYIEHTDSRFEPESLRRFVRAYQEHEPLRIGELWAIPVCLRLLLVENLRRLADRIVEGRSDRERADSLADTFVGLTESRSSRATDDLRFVRTGPMSAPFAVELLQRLRDRDPTTTPALRILDERFVALGTTRDEIVAREHQRQAATHVTIRNIITSMRTVSAEDWPTFFESVSLVDEILRARAEFALSDFPTRDRCRAAIEELGRGSGWSETDIARLAADSAARHVAEVDDSRHRDPAYYLIAGGRKLLEREIAYRVPLRQRLRRGYAAHATPTYLMSMGILAAGILAAPCIAAAMAGASGWALATLALLGAIPASELAIAIVNASVSDVVGARRLARLSLAKGIPAELGTLVAVPSLLTDESDVRDLLESLEVHYLSNNDGAISFALVTDWVDAPVESMPDDDRLLRLAAQGVAELNGRYGVHCFYLFHRRRLYNPAQQAFMGWERKRGKIHELNRLLRGALDTSFIDPNGLGAVTYPLGVQYVITLDADTQMPRGTALQLVGTAAHPLNRPIFDAQRGKVIAGHAILQPRVTSSLPCGLEGTLFQRVFSGPQGTDPYAFVVFDVYQDLFGEGIYTGKGIYEIDAFERATGGRFPENAVLSHDLIEGIAARAGFVSDVELFESFPSHYEIAARRQHRWMRGDWQLLPWIFGWQKGDTGSPVVVHGIARWKLLDNLRRTLGAPAALATLMVCWLLSGRTAQIWTTFVLATVVLPRGFSVLSGIIPQRPNIAKRTHLLALFSDIETAVWQMVLDVTFLPHKAYLAMDAITRTLARLVVTRRRLLEWTTAAQARVGIDLDVGRTYARMWSPVVLAVAISCLLAVLRPGDFWTWGPLTVLWALSPAMARASSSPRWPESHQVLSKDQKHLLQVVARKTWRFFETFVAVGDHQLPPDNFQEDPRPVTAHRTSPTNVGLYLLSTVAAYDFGWVTPADLPRRLAETLSTLGRLERCHGHFYNWYDTEKLVPLVPLYVSTVDSGNLAGHLIAVAHACHEYARSRALGPRLIAGFQVNLAVFTEAWAEFALGRVTDDPNRARIDDLMASLSSLGEVVPPSVSAFRRWFADLEVQSSALIEALRATSSANDPAEVAPMQGAEALRDFAVENARSLEQMFPWAELVEDSDGEVRSVLDALDTSPPSPVEAAERYASARRDLEAAASASARALELRSCAIDALDAAGGAAVSFAAELERIAVLCQRLMTEMEFGFLFDPTKKLFSIGYRVSDGKLDESYYDLLASEARLSSFVAIAKGDVPASHWQKLGRPLTPAGRGSALLSWSGSMFEYLMPELVMRDPEGSLLDQTAHLVVKRQMAYARPRGVPWGISESAYNARDAALNYQYSSFGVSGLGLKRGLSQNLVIAPYASALAAMVRPASSADNLARLGRMKCQGTYGFYEAIDFTPTRLEEGQTEAIVRAYFAHHQGMTLVSLANVLHGGKLRSRFHSDVMVRAADLLLHERTPRSVAVARPRADEVSSDLRIRDLAASALRIFQSPHHESPRTHLLSNGNYSVMVTAAGAGYSRSGATAVTRWRDDATRGAYGVFVYLRDVRTGRFWSAGYQPSLVEPESYEMICSEDRIEIRRHDRSVSTTTEILVSPEDDAEVRRVSLHNTGTSAREIEVTSYVELALAPQAADEAHPAFSSLFVETEFAADVGALLATRRKRTETEPTVWVAHVAAVQGETIGDVEYETNRASFIGRGATIAEPRCVARGERLSGETGTVLCPVLALRHRLRIPAGETACITYAVVMCDSRDKALQAAQRYRVATAFERTATLAWTHAQVKLRHQGIDPEEAHVFQRLAGYLVFRCTGGDTHAAVGDVQLQGTSALWSYGISGDLPIIVLRIDDDHDRDVARQLIRAHEYWYEKAFSVDVVILNERPPSYEQDLENGLQSLVRTSHGASPVEGDKTRGGIYVLRGDLMLPGDRHCLLVSARLVLTAHAGSLADQVTRRMRAEPRPREPARAILPASGKPVSVIRPALELDNGWGGFTAGGSEYVVMLGDGAVTPAPWINVIANERFGFQVSESGSGYTWSENSHENQLTGWSNDPVVDPASEVIYVRDDESGEVWGPTANPIRERSPYVARHGFGYTCFEHESHDIRLKLVQFTAAVDPVKVSRLTIHNRSGRRRTLSIVAYVEWVLGASRPKSAPFVVTTADETGALFAENMGNAEFAGRTAFADLGGAQTSWTCDRKEFLGPHGDIRQPPGMAPRVVLSKRAGSGLDACAVLLTTVTLGPDAQTDVRFVLGQAMDRTEARVLVKKYRTEDLQASLDEVRRRWRATLGVLQVKTPDRELDLMLNGWLLYQTLSCRMWARAAFYQAGGAFGFRDQLQDSMALAVARPDLARAQLLRAAARQFVEGDVQHWWHPPSGRGVRTHVSDDRVWLPYVLLHYLEVTQDQAVLDAEIPFLEGPPLAAGQEDAYFTPVASAQQATLFEHCARSLDTSLSVGPHGLPLMGTGDWNDGMNRVGREGAGESVWLAWFLCATLRDFSVIAERRGESVRVATWRRAREALGKALEDSGWDGAWYRRAFFDDGSPLGASSNAECRIDAIAQSWAVLSGAAPDARAAQAMQSVQDQLVRTREQIIVLLTPPFDGASRSPGYIAAYPPGIRENGGQYTHAAAWTVMAFAGLGAGDKAVESLQMLNPLRHARSPEGATRYAIEPYVVAGDVYSSAQRMGRGGWSWYTGSAGWLYRAGIESILGFRLHGNRLTIDPCVSPKWDRFELSYTFGSARYDIVVENPDGVMRGVGAIAVDGSAAQPGGEIRLIDDGRKHQVRVTMK